MGSGRAQDARCVVDGRLSRLQPPTTAIIRSSVRKCCRRVRLLEKGVPADASDCRSAALSRKCSDFITEPRAATFPRSGYWSVAVAPATSGVMGEHVTKQNIDHRRVNTNRPRKQTAEANGRRLLDVIVYGKSCRIGGKVWTILSKHLRSATGRCLTSRWPVLMQPLKGG